MLRRWLDSPWPYFIGAAILLVLAIASQFEVRLPPRSKESIDSVATLKERDDVNVVFVLIDTLGPTGWASTATSARPAPTWICWVARASSSGT